MEVDNISESGHSMQSSWIIRETDGQDLDHQFANTNMNSNEVAYEDFIYDDKGSEEFAYVPGKMEEDERGLEYYRENSEEEIEEADEEMKEDAEPFCYDDGSVNSDEELDLYSQANQDVGGKKLTWPEKVDTLRTRTFIDYLSRKAEAKRTLVLTTREELENCLTQVKQLEQERDKVFAEVETQEQQENIAAVIRLRSQHDKICRQLELETELEAKIREKLVQAEYQSNLVELEQGRAVKLNQELLEKERLWEQERNEEGKRRLIKEERSAVTVVANEKLQERMFAMKKKEEEERRRHEAEEAKKCHEKHQTFLARSLDKARQMETMQKQREAEIMETRIKSVLTLKSDIAANKENLKVQITRNKAHAKQEKEMERKWLEEIEAEGKNPTLVLARQQRTTEFNREKQQFEGMQRQREIEIAEKILMEKKVLEKRKKLMPELFVDPKTEKAKFVKPLRRRNLRVLDQLRKAALPPPSPQYDRTRGREDDDSDNEGSMEQDENMKQSKDEDLCHLESEDQQMNDLAQPEFEGLWDQFKPYKTHKETDKTGVIKKGASKMENEILAQRLQKLREGIVVKQVAVGREFKGRAFKSKPEVIHFKDFDVGESYQKRVILTNVSHTLNSCKLSGLSEQLKDFVELKFNPPGQLSAGLTCELTVTFNPMINKDLEGEVKFLAQTGPFSIPVICTTKKCIMRVDMPVVDFGTSVVGETLKKTVTLTNAGALPTSFQFFRCSDKKTEDVVLIRETDETISALDENVGGEKRDETLAAADAEELENGEEEKEAEDAAEKTSISDAKDDDRWPDGSTRLLVPDDMKVGQVVSGTVAAYSSVKLEVIWLPSIPGRISTDFAISFQAPDVAEILVTAVGDAFDIPVWIERKTVDLKICMFDRLFQDSIVIHNRAAMAYNLKFEVCKELRNHLELLPKSGYIQAQSQFTAQLKFLPRKMLYQDASQFFDKDTGVFEAPLVIHVVGQTLPVVFSVHAVVTSSDLEFDQTVIDFGHCTIHETAVFPIKLTNMSLLPQDFGFMGCPDYVDIQPNDGFGTLLPRETIFLDVVFRPKKADVYNFELICKSLINREFKIQCSGIGVHPLLRLSHQVIQFPATAINDHSTVSIEVINDHTSPNEILKPAPRIGKGPVAPVGPTSFEFRVPDEVPIFISPQVGTVLPGQKCKVSVRFSPTFDDQEVRQEAVRVVAKALELKAEEEFQMALRKAREAEEQAAAAKAKKDKSSKEKSSKEKSSKEKSSKEKSGRKISVDSSSSAAVAEKGPAAVEPPSEAEIAKNSPEYYAGLASLIKKFTRKFNTLSIPCYLASGACDRPGQLAYSVENTVYVEVNCPVIQPQLLILSDTSQTTVDFGDVSIGQRIIKTVTVQNISGRNIDLHGSCLNPDGPFVLLNALRTLAPDQILNLHFSFAPHKTEKFQQVQEIHSPASTMFLSLKGVGVSPIVTVSVSDNLLEMGNVMAGDVREETFKIINTSKLNVNYSLSLESHSLHRKQRMQLMAVVRASDAKHKNSVGTQNFSGKQVFDCVPKEGIIGPGATQDIVVTFSPDQPSDHFRDRCHIQLFGKDEDSHAFDIVGRGRAHNMYVSGGDVLSPEVETLSVAPELEREEDAKAPAIPVLVTLHSLATETECTTAARDIVIGCVKSYSGAGRKGGKQNAEWSFESMQQATALGFNIDPLKGTVEAGTERNVTISWAPPAGHNPNTVASTAINCTIKGDVVETYRFLLKAFVNAN